MINHPKKTLSRRKFLNILGKTTGGLVLTPFIKSANVAAYGHEKESSFLAQVGVTQADNYDRALIKSKVQHLFESIGGIGDVIKSGDKVAIKINLTGGSGSVGQNDWENTWTHPEVLRAVGELIIDSGVSGNDLYIVEALWDEASYHDYGFKEVQDSLGAQFFDLNSPAPYGDFMDVPVGDDKFYYNSFKMNQKLQDVDVYVSIPKMKQHYNAGVTHSIKNQVGIVPLQHYIKPGMNGYRSALHYDGGNIDTHLPRSICDLFLARPVDLAVIDGVKNADGGEGNWNSTFQTAEYHMLLAGKDPIATDSVASYLMGNDPEADKLRRPDPSPADEDFPQCDNYLEMLHQKGLGTNQMAEIEIVGDGAGLVNSVIPEYKRIVPENFMLFQNFPNPFNPTTAIKFYLPHQAHVTMKIFSITGKEVETLVDGFVPSGQHKIYWTPKNLASGVYLYRFQAGNFSDTKKLIFDK